MLKTKKSFSCTLSKNWFFPLRIFAIMTLLATFGSCRKVTPTSTSNTAGTAKLCISGGATLDAAANICVCPQGLEWSGQKCEAAQGAQLTDGPHGVDHPPTETATDKELQGHEAAAVTEPAVPDHKPEKPKSNDTEWVETFKKRCISAKGKFIANEQYCLCPDTKVLVGFTCRRLQGRVNDDLCLRAVRPGKWLEGVCVCPKNQIFAPNRGGCVAPLTYGKKSKSGLTHKGVLAILKRNCESSVNTGLWDPLTQDCTCPEERGFVQELCVERHRVSSKELCESLGQQGRWMRDLKTCQCPPGRMWVNQKCTLYSDITPQDGCHSNGSGGTWDQAKETCLCPTGKVWAISGKSCRFTN